MQVIALTQNRLIAFVALDVFYPAIARDFLNQRMELSQMTGYARIEPDATLNSFKDEIVSRATEILQIVDRLGGDGLRD